MFSWSVKSEKSILVDFQLNWRKLQQMGLNAYEARSYIVLMGHPRFKALDLAGRAHVPRQKVYEVLDSLVDKGFAQVIQDKTKLFSAIDPSLAIPGFLARRNKVLQQELMEQQQVAYPLIQDLREMFQEGRGGEGPLDFLSLVNDATQAVLHYRRMLKAASQEYRGLYQPAVGTDPINDDLLSDVRGRGIACRLLMQSSHVEYVGAERLRQLQERGIAVRFFDRLPIKLALFDKRCGLLTLPDPVRSTPSWTSVVFEHDGFAEAMSNMFESYWQGARGEP